MAQLQDQETMVGDRALNLKILPIPVSLATESPYILHHPNTIARTMLCRILPLSSTREIDNLRATHCLTLMHLYQIPANQEYHTALAHCFQDTDCQGMQIFFVIPSSRLPHSAPSSVVAGAQHIRVEAVVSGW